jgi:hypothetical protein
MHAVDIAYEALSRFGDDLTRGQAAALQHEALLARFRS